MDRQQYLGMNGSTTTNGSWLGRTLTIVGGVAIAVVAVLASAMLAGVLLLIGLVAWVVFWWKTRALRKAMREAAMREQMYAMAGGRSGATAQKTSKHVVLEGDFIREVDDAEKHR